MGRLHRKQEYPRARWTIVHGRLATELPAFVRRLDRQAIQTADMRHAVYEAAGLRSAQRILVVGSGSGAVAQDVATGSDAEVVGVDFDATMAKRAGERQMAVAQADGRGLPFADHAFDAAVCNLTLMWCPEPAAMVQEMARVVRPGGVVVASMEPDYGGKVHHPENPLIDVVFRGEAIAARGGDPHAGRKLRSHFVGAGLRTEVGIGNLEVPTTEQDLAHLRRNRKAYRRMLAEAGRTQTEIDAWEAEYREALEAGVQLSFLPVFWAIGRVRDGDLDLP